MTPPIHSVQDICTVDDLRDLVKDMEIVHPVAPKGVQLDADIAEWLYTNHLNFSKTIRFLLRQLMVQLGARAPDAAPLTPGTYTDYAIEGPLKESLDGLVKKEGLYDDDD